MQADDRAAGVALRQQVALIESEAERGNVCSERVVRADRLLDEIRSRRFDPFVDVLAEVAVGPAVETAVDDGGDVVGHEIVADFIALVDGSPQRVGEVRIADGLPGKGSSGGAL